jgi:hypothetical protein
MKKFEVCIVSKEYRWVEVEADDEAAAKDRAWDLISDGYVGDTPAQDSESDIYVEGEVKEENENA